MLLGLNAKMYYQSGGSYGSPTWVEIDCVSDLKVDPVYDTVEIPTRASKVKKMGKTLVGVTISGTLKASLTNAPYLAVYAAFLGQTTELDILVLNGSNSTNGAHGFRGPMFVTKAGEDQGTTAGIKTEIELVPADPATVGDVFASALVTTGAPVFTTL